MTKEGRRELREQIVTAIGMHYALMAEIRESVIDGRTALRPEVVCREDSCEIGVWLIERISPELRTTELYTESRKAHAAFHREFAHIVALLHANDATAHHAIAPGSAFAVAASDLRKRLSSWLALARDGAAA